MSKYRLGVRDPQVGIVLWHDYQEDSQGAYEAFRRQSAPAAIQQQEANDEWVTVLGDAFIDASDRGRRCPGCGAVNSLICESCGALPDGSNIAGR